MWSDCKASRLHGSAIFYNDQTMLYHLATHVKIFISTSGIDVMVIVLSWGWQTQVNKHMRSRWCALIKIHTLINKYFSPTHTSSDPS